MPKSIGKIGLSTAKWTFTIGTALIVLFFFFTNFTVALTGYLFLAAAILVNLVVATMVLVASRRRLLRLPLLKVIGRMTLNVPIFLVYYFCFLQLTQTLRLTVSNSENITVRDIKVTGCEDDVIDFLLPNESYTFWLPISAPCFIEVTYSKGGSIIREVILDTEQSAVGQQVQYELGGTQVALDDWD